MYNALEVQNFFVMFMKIAVGMKIYGGDAYRIRD